MGLDDVDPGTAIAAADPVVLRAALWIQTRSDEMAAMPTHRPGAKPGLTVAPLELLHDSDVARVRSEALEMVGAIAAGDVEVRRPEPDDVPTIVELLTGVRPDDETHEFWREELPVGDCTRRADPIDQRRRDATFPDLHVVIIGSGMGGISAAVMLQAAGIPFTIIEKNAGVGGTWYQNRYPGLRVDLPSRAYSFTFEPDHLWRHWFAPQAELLEYLEHTVERRGFEDRIVFDTEVVSLTWNEDTQQWTVVTRSSDGTSGEYAANFVFSAVGLFGRPRRADIDGLDDFAGAAMHTSEWDPSVSIEGQRVGVVGTGSSGVQVVRSLAETAARVTIFQRTASWLGHIPGYTDPIPDGELWMIANFPFYVNCVRIMQIYSIGDSEGREGIHDIDPDWDDPHTVSQANAEIRDELLGYLRNELAERPDLIDKCTPTFPPLAKRLPMDNGWYASLLLDHVDLETRPISRVVPDGVEVDSGEVIELDVLVLATGYRANDFLWPMEITGVDGVSLSKVWERDGARAFLGIMVPGFPNLFCLYGPNTNPISGGPCMWGELQARFGVEAIGALTRAGRRSLDVRAEVFEEYNRRLDDKLADKIWFDRRQRSYFLNEHGRVAVNAPWRTREYWRWTRRPDLDDYVLHGGPDDDD